jgi:hypothetical protein
LKNKSGNYWLDLIEFEKVIKDHIEQSISIFVGKRYSSQTKLKHMVRDAVKDCLDEYAKQEFLNHLNVDYELNLDYRGDTFVSFTISYVHAD